MKTIIVKTPKRSWEARYRITKGVDAAYIYIEARSAIELAIAKLTTADPFFPGESNTHYYVASPNFNVALPSIPYLNDSFWIEERLSMNGMPDPDAATVARVLADIDF